ncbi:leucyl/phenylalanyl-tRNA--protein transferase [Aromatoleum bremense]|uniref:Leucyl/phenylalanyl-tRNA--protein transferase n=1 Tax=Aromatoleum bremense TaxID=76115 RepID=A0ABX1NUG0_9RHOO|nr:leucyl/phenylalanyl-tRNA--protein transferase [Aromatoleum bremense]NMG15644.1 leucyl/phenylalanyl-tRNA--protein transferase [Aromatoleum bremense]QTQ30624.1 Leucyl/phenylalanyl-tRNA-protein transferase [Aromatoleum bremense]
MIPWLAGRPDFPPVEQALADPDGLLAAGGELSPAWLLAAYRRGIFPWYTEDQPILWWSPDPRLVLIPGRLRISRSLRRTLRQQRFDVRFDTAFADVIAACAEPREPGGGTWISAEIRQAYLRLHELGYAHSVESWVDGTLVGGLYGIALGRAFFGESMFSRRSDASKVALAHLAVHLQRLGFAAIDCQMTTAHLLSLGAEEMPRAKFCAGLASWTNEGAGPGRWSCEGAAEISRNFS